MDREDKNILSSRHTTVSIHIALKRADMYKHRKAFDYNLNKNPEILKQHDEITCFDWNFKVQRRFISKNENIVLNRCYRYVYPFQIQVQNPFTN